MVILDVWEGEVHENHIARYIVEFNQDTFNQIQSELAQGNLVNIRTEPGWRSYSNWDERLSKLTNTV